MTRASQQAATRGTAVPIRRSQRSRSKVETGIWVRDYGRPLKGLNTDGGPSSTALARPAWRMQGACTDGQSEAWFSEADTLKTRRAIRVCGSCPVRQLCLAAALVFDEEFGVWGGLTPTQRRPFVARLEEGEPLGRVLAAAEPSATQGAA